MRWQYSTCKEEGKCFNIKQSTNLRFQDFMSFRQFYLFCDCTSFTIFSSRKLKITSVLESEFQNSVTYWGPYFFAFSVSLENYSSPILSICSSSWDDVNLVSRVACDPGLVSEKAPVPWPWWRMTGLRMDLKIKSMFCADISRRKKKKISLFTGVDKMAGCKLRATRTTTEYRTVSVQITPKRREYPTTQFKPRDTARTETSHIFQLTSPLSQYILSFFFCFSNLSCFCHLKPRMFINAPAK